jgi:predicted tellurium resistance membrane protein TerC
MVFRIILLGLVRGLLSLATRAFLTIDGTVFPGVHLHSGVSAKAAVVSLYGLVLIWKGIEELRGKAKGMEKEVHETERFHEFVAAIVGMNLLLSVKSVLTAVGRTDVFAVMVGSVVISGALMLAFAIPVARFFQENPEFEILGFFALLLMGFVLFREGGHKAGLTVNASEFPYISQWIVIFILLLRFSVDLYQNCWEAKVRRRAPAPVTLRRRRK